MLVKREHYAVYGIPLALYIIASLLLWMNIESIKGHYDVDSYGYDPIALYFAQTGLLTDPHNIVSPPVQPVGYHFFLGLLYLFFGHHVAAVVLVQLLLMIAVIMMLISIAMRLQGREVAMVVGLLAAINIGFLIYPQLILAETLLVFLLLLFVSYYINFLERSEESKALIFSGLLLGISMLVKPVALLFIVPLLILTYIAHDISMIKRMRNLLLLSVCFALPIISYMERNYICYGTFSFAPMAQLNIYQCFLAKVISHVESIEQQEVIETKLRFTAHQAFDDAGWHQAQEYFSYYISSYPHIFCYIWMINVIKTWLGLYITQLKSMIEPPDHLPLHSFFNQKGSLLDRFYSYIVGATSSTGVITLAWIEFFYTVMRLGCAAIGLFILFHRRGILGWFFLSMMIVFSIVTGIDGCCRYRITFEPILLLLAAMGLVYLYKYCSKKIKERVYEIA